MILIVTIITSASDAVGVGSHLHECLTLPACSNRTSQHVKLACEADCVELFLLDNKITKLKNKIPFDNKIKMVKTLDNIARKTRKQGANNSSHALLVTPMVHRKKIISSTKETDSENSEAKSSYQLRHKKQSKPEEKKSESHLQGELEGKNRNKIGIE